MLPRDTCYTCGHSEAAHKSAEHDDRCTKKCKAYLAPDDQPQPPKNAKCVCGHKSSKHPPSVVIEGSNEHGPIRFWCIANSETSKLEGSYHNAGVDCACDRFELASAIPKPKKLKVMRCKCGHSVKKHANSHGLITWCDLCDCEQFVSEVLNNA